MNQKDYWDSAAGSKEFTTPFHGSAFARYVGKDDVIVDIGCGYGRTLNELHEAGFVNLSGFDFSQKMIERGRRSFPFLNLNVQSGGVIDLDDGTVDAVILFAVLTCITDDREQEGLIGEIERILKPGGVIYVNDFLLNSDARNVERYERFKERYGVYGAFELPEGAVLRHHSEEHVNELLAGFQALEYENVTFKTMNGHTSRGFYFIGRKVVPDRGRFSV